MTQEQLINSKSLSIYEIKRWTMESEPYFFSPKTLNFFGQKISGFSVKKQFDGKYYISAPMYKDGRQIGLTERLFNPSTLKLEFINK